ncbi:MAG: hypothetical protein AMJ59_06505 [Gammaproteobacteria bacterium SG8_31]|jgi:pimeloyl-ACP methyl ester carboxylesterase/DNA-binding CsgD family transcriptional regulator|nr:MAG: hypothetical protein AMJ59_06505 [Gammaproteobacteria bacterium SG8_31]
MALTEIPMRQSIRFLKTADGVTLAWAEAGEGPALVKVANWLSHLEYDWDSPCWRHWMHFFAANYRFIRYDERGCGMTDWDVGDLSPARWIEDLEAVVDKAGPAEPFILLGISQGTAAAIQFAALHPDKVSHLVLYGGYSQGWKFRENDAGRRAYEAIVELARFGWGQDNPVFRQLFTSRFLPDATEDQIAWFNELCRRTTKPDIAARLLQARAEVNVADYLARVRAPTLVIHAQDDEVVPLAAGRRLASEIRDAEFVQLASRNHILLESEPAWTRFKEILLDFTGRPPGGARAEDPVFQVLSDRERQILARMGAGESNVEIGKALFISDKTVRNHVTRIFEKLGVSSRAQAIVMAHEKGFRGSG